MSLDALIKEMVKTEVEAAKQEILAIFELKSPLVEINEASKLMGVSESVLYKMCREKRIPHIKYGKDGSKRPKIKFRVIDIHKWLAEQCEMNYERR